ncbi:uncharacterized protein [Macrobrachium rosenbergii]
MIPLVVREARVSDCQMLELLMQESIKEQKITDVRGLTCQDLQSRGFGNDPAFHIFVSELSSGVVNGYLLYIYCFSSMAGRVVVVKDIYVTPEYRRRGMATALWKTLVQKVSAEGCKRCDIYTKAPNKFLLSIGAHDDTVSEYSGDLVYEIKKDAMEELIKRHNIPSEFILREATAKDIPDIFESVKSLHLYLGLLDEVVIDETVLMNEGFGKRPLFKSYVVERNGSVVGYTMFSYTYGFDGPEVYMEDLYVSSTCRGTGIGTALWAVVLKETLKIGGRRCTHIVASDNKASIGYYKSKGAQDLSQTKNIHIFKQLMN